MPVPGPDCKAPRPCRRLDCRYVLPGGKCVWDVVEAHDDGMTCEEIGEVLGGITRQAVEQIIRKALEKVHRAMLRDERPALTPWAAERVIDPYADAMPREPAIDPYGGAIDHFDFETR